MKQAETSSHSATSTMEKLPSDLKPANRDSPEPLAQPKDKQRVSPVTEAPSEVPNEASKTTEMEVREVLKEPGCHRSMPLPSVGANFR